DRVGELVVMGTEDASGLHAKWRLFEDVRSGRRASWSDFGVFQTGEVLGKSARLRQDASGGVHPLNSRFAKSESNTEAWLSRRGYFRSNSDGAGLSPAARREEDGRRFDVITATPPQAEPV